VNRTSNTSRPNTGEFNKRSTGSSNSFSPSRGGGGGNTRSMGGARSGGATPRGGRR
jgi:hypothetical protein